MWNQVIPSETMCPSESYCVQFSETKCIQTKPSEIKRNQVKPSDTSWNQVWPSGIKSHEVKWTEVKWNQVWVYPREPNWIQVSPTESKRDQRRRRLPPILLSNFSWLYRYVCRYVYTYWYIHIFMYIYIYIYGYEYTNTNTHTRDQQPWRWHNITPAGSVYWEFSNI